MENHGERERDGGIQVRERERGGSSREIERDVNVKVDDTIFFSSSGIVVKKGNGKRGFTVI